MNSTSTLSSAVKSILVLILTLTSNHVFAQEYNLNLNFLPRFEQGATLSSVIELRDNTVLAISNSTNVGNKAVYGIVKLYENGDIDPSFDTSVRFTGSLKHAAQQTDGKILLAGSLYTGTPSSYKGIVRLNTDGSLDNTFSAPLSLGTIMRVIIQPDGKIIIGGGLMIAGSTAQRNIIRLNTDGSVDESFHYQSVPNGNINDFQLQADGKIVAVGRFIKSGLNHDTIIRLDRNGAIDPSFSATFKLRDHGGIIKSIALQPDNKVLFVTSHVHSSYEQLDNAILYGLCRLNPDGSLDETFDNPFRPKDGVALTGALNHVTTSDNKILVAGDILQPSEPGRRSLVISFYTDGRIDTEFKSPTQYSNSANWVLVKGNKQLLVGGQINLIENQLYSGLIKLDDNGSLIESFAPDLRFTPISTPIIEHVAQQADGGTLVVGSFSYVNNQRISNIVKLKADGSIDDRFNNKKTDGSDTILLQFHHIAKQGDRTLAVATVLFGETEFYGIIRLNQDGSLDETFLPVSFEANSIQAIAAQPDNKILVAVSNKIVRLMSDGAKDHNFTSVDFHAFSISSLLVPKNEQILVLCNRLDDENKAFASIVRLNADGTPDYNFDGNSFRYNSSFSPFVTDMAIDPQGLIVVTGSFNFYKDNRVYNGILHIDYDGHFIKSNPLPFNMIMQKSIDISKQRDITLGGNFAIDGKMHYVLRLSTLPLFAEKPLEPEEITKLYPNPTENKVEISFTNDYQGVVGFEVINNIGKTVYSGQTRKHTKTLNYNLDLSSMKDGLYIVNIVCDQNRIVKKVLKVSK